MPGVFLSYRRADTDFALEIYTSVRGRWGRGTIFWDAESIETGAKWADAIRDSVRTADAVLVLIGPDWLTVANADGVRRLDAPDDWVRLEIEEALSANRPILPILAPGASAPRRTDLPQSIAALADLQGIRMDYRRFATRLIQTLERRLGPVVEGVQELDPLRGERLTRLLTSQTQRLQIRAVELVEQGRYDRAIEELNEGTEVLMTLLDFAPNDATLGLQQGYLYKTVGQAYQDAGREDEADRQYALAEVVFERVRDLGVETGLTASERAGAVNGLGAIYQGRGDLVAAMRAYREATQLYPSYGYAWHDLAGVLIYLAERQGMANVPAMQTAVEQLELYSKDRYGHPVPGLGAETVERLRNWVADITRRLKDPNRQPAATAWMTYAYELMRAGDFEKAQAPLDEAIDTDPHLPEPWVYRGAVRIGFGQLEEGLADLEHALALRPGMDTAYYNAACGYALKGERKKALDFLEEAILAQPGWKEEAIRDSHLDSVRHLRRFAKLVGTSQSKEKAR